MFKYAMDDWYRRNDQSRRRRHRKEQRQFDSAILRVGRGLGVRSGDLPRKRRQDRGSNCDANQSQWQLVQTVRIIEPGYRPFWQEPRGERR